VSPGAARSGWITTLARSTLPAWRNGETAWPDPGPGAYRGRVAEVFERLDERWRRFIAAQPMFFVATAPSGPDGHVNVSPKGYADTFAVLDDLTVAYLDLDGSGVETIAHLRQNGRITLMFCSFGRTAKILRLYGRGRVVGPRDPHWPDLRRRFGEHPGVRSIIVVELDRISDACGFGVPTMTEATERSTLDSYAGRPQTQHKRAARNAAPRRSIDGEPARPLER
jgi:hypothetical protein